MDYKLQQHQWNMRSTLLKSHFNSFYILGFLFPWVTSCYAVWKTLLLPEAFTSTVSQDLAHHLLWQLQSHLAPQKIGKILERAVTKPSLDKVTRTCNSAKLAWTTPAFISKYCLECPRHVPAWLTGSGAALLLSGLEETSLYRTMRPRRDSMDFILGVNEWYRAPQSLAILTAYTADAQNLLPNPPSLLAQQRRSTQKTRF